MTPNDYSSRNNYLVGFPVIDYDLLKRLNRASAREGRRHIEHLVVRNGRRYPLMQAHPVGNVTVRCQVVLSRDRQEWLDIPRQQFQKLSKGPS